MKKTLFAAFTLPLLLTACLVEETTHTLYLSPDGSLVWSVLEKDVRSDEDDPGKRATEERDYLDLFAHGEHPVAVALRRLGGEVGSTLVRGERPYTTVTEARFASAARLGDAVAAGLGVPGGATLDVTELDGSARELRLRFVLDVPLDDESDVADETLLDLLEDEDRYHFVLTAGRFTTARGFHLVDDDTRAILAKVSEEEVEAQDGHFELELVWRVEAGA